MTDTAKDNAGTPARTPRTAKKRSRIGRIVRRIGWTVVGLIAFGIVVSIASVLAVRDASVAVRPDSAVRITEGTQLYPITVARVVEPRTIEEIASAVKAWPGRISVGGGRNSMGGQTASPDGLQIDMRSYHGVIALDTAARTVVVKAGTRWRELQEAIDTH